MLHKIGSQMLGKAVTSFKKKLWIKSTKKKENHAYNLITEESGWQEAQGQASLSNILRLSQKQIS